MVHARPVLLLAMLATVALAGCVKGPESLACRADEEGIHLEWSPVENATSYLILRNVAGDESGENVTVAETNETHALDAEVEEGVTYEYFVVAFVGEEGVSEPSPLCEVTAVPFAPGQWVLPVAAAGVVAAYVALRRR